MLQGLQNWNRAKRVRIFQKFLTIQIEVTVTRDNGKIQ